VDGSRVGLVSAVVAVLLAGSAIGVAAEATAQEAMTSDFAPPFRYVLPGAMWQAGTYEEDQVFAFAEGGPDVEGTISGDGGGASGFDESGEDGARGIQVVNVTDALTHPCPLAGGSSRVPLGDEPADFIADLESISGLRLEDVEGTTLDGRPAVRATALASRCGSNDLHLSPGIGRWVTLRVPARLIVSQVGGATVLIQIWADTILDLESWLPVAQQTVDSIDFDEPERGATPSAGP
jgi:hypothetical protein